MKDSEKNKDLVGAAAFLSEKGVREITILHGEAKKQLNLLPVKIEGNITAPSLFIESRKDKYDVAKSHCIIDRFSGEILLKIDENNPNDNYTIYGKITLGKLFTSLGINTGKSYTTDKLGNELRMLRSIFINTEDHAAVVKELKNFNGKINKEVEKADDNRGNKLNLIRQFVTSNVPKAFAIKVPLIEGEEPCEFAVEILIEVGASGDIQCTLESVDAKEILDNLTKKVIEAEVEKLTGKTTIVYV